MTLQDQFEKPVLFHWVGWYGKDGFPTKTGYDSRDPTVISNQLAAMKALGGPDTGVIALTYGLTSDFITQAVLAIANQTSALMMPFALCMDPWSVKNATNKNQHMIDTLNTWPYTAILNMDNYLLDSTGKMILDFATGVSQSAIQAAYPKVHYMMNGPDFDWVRIPTQPNKTSLPCAYIEFDDGTGANRNVSIDNPSQPARIVPSYAGDTFWACNITSGSAYVQIVTWNDVTESTDIEKFASMISVKI